MTENTDRYRLVDGKYEGIPKDGIHSYGTYEDGRFEHHPLGE